MTQGCTSLLCVQLISRLRKLSLPALGFTVMQETSPETDDQLCHVAAAG